MYIIKYIFQALVSCFPDMVKIVTLQGRPKSNRKQLPQLNFDFTVESIGKSAHLLSISFFPSRLRYLSLLQETDP
jgi:hypothetical protein